MIALLVECLILVEIGIEVESLDEWFPTTDVHVKEVQRHPQGGFKAIVLVVVHPIKLEWRQVERKDRQEVTVTVVNHDAFKPLRVH